VDKVRLAQGLGIGALGYQLLIFVAYVWGDGTGPLDRLRSDVILFLVLYGLPLGAAIAGTVVYARLPEARQRRSALVAPVSLALLILFPAILVALWTIALSGMGDV
jgi:hypothetical protein